MVVSKLLASEAINFEFLNMHVPMIAYNVAPFTDCQADFSQLCVRKILGKTQFIVYLYVVLFYKVTYHLQLGSSSSALGNAKRKTGDTVQKWTVVTNTPSNCTK